MITLPESLVNAWLSIRVERNRAIVHDATSGRVGYLHIPDMQAHGYAGFHRGFLAEVTREGLIVDVRYNNVERWNVEG